MKYEMKENENETLVVMEGGERDLRERTKAFALRIIKLFVALPKRAEAQVLGKQVLRSGTSVGANYREAWRARSRAEFVSKIGDCLKELDESAYWLELLVESEIVAPTRLAVLQDECNQLLAIFTHIIKRVQIFWNNDQKRTRRVQSH